MGPIRHPVIEEGKKIVVGVAGRLLNPNPIQCPYPLTIKKKLGQNHPKQSMVGDGSDSDTNDLKRLKSEVLMKRERKSMAGE